MLEQELPKTTDFSPLDILERSTKHLGGRHHSTLYLSSVIVDILYLLHVCSESLRRKPGGLWVHDACAVLGPSRVHVGRPGMASDGRAEVLWSVSHLNVPSGPLVDALPLLLLLGLLRWSPRDGLCMDRERSLSLFLSSWHALYSAVVLMCLFYDSPYNNYYFSRPNEKGHPVKFVTVE